MINWVTLSASNATLPGSLADDPTGTEPEATPAVTPEATPEAAPEIKPETTPETTPEVKPEAKPETKPEVKPETKPEVVEGEEETGEEGTLVNPSPEAEAAGSSGIAIWKIGIAAVLLILVVGIVVVCLLKKKKKSSINIAEPEEAEAPVVETKSSTTQKPETLTGEIRVGKLHNIGKRAGQQDCLGVTEVPNGMCAVVADGMGGLADGDKVSKKIVMTMLQDAVQNKNLTQMVAHANNEVNRMLGRSNQYKSGSTVVAVLAGQSEFEWISVGDSRIYLYRNEKMIQLNREHTYEAELIQKAVNGEMTFAEVQRDPQRHKLTSFIGMGTIKHIDASLRPVAVQAGDRLLLMSDGVFNTLSENRMAEILKANTDPQQAAAVMEESILAAEKPKQDNFTAIILQFE